MEMKICPVLEQNRYLGLYSINVCEVKYDGREINTKDDL